MFSDVIGAFVLSRLGISINELLGISEGRLIYNTTSKIIHLFLLVIIILFTNARFDSKALLHAIPLMLCNLSSIFCTAEVNDDHPTLENGKLAAFASGRPAFREHAKHAEGSDTTPRLAHTESP